MMLIILNKIIKLLHQIELIGLSLAKHLLVKEKFNYFIFFMYKKNRGKIFLGIKMIHLQQQNKLHIMSLNNIIKL